MSRVEFGEQIYNNESEEDEIRWRCWWHRRWQRRAHFKFSEYEQKVVLPMYRQFAEPTKQYAKHVIDVTNLSKDQVLKCVDRIISPLL